MQKRLLKLLVAAVAAGGLLGCDQVEEPPPQQAEVPQQASFTGSLSYRARIALPPQAEVVLTMRDLNSATVSAEHRFEIGERQVPIPFDWAVDSAQMNAGGPHEFLASIEIDGEPRWVSAPLRVTPSAPALGEILLTPRDVAQPSSTFLCGNTLVRFMPGDGDMADMQIANSAYAMQQVVAASGAKYENLGNPNTVFWSKGDGASVSVDGASLPECHKIEEAETRKTTVYTARGNEPGWNLQIEGDSLRLVTDHGGRTVTATVDQDRPTTEGHAVVARSEESAVTVTIINLPCRDDMSGEPFPQQVTVELDTRTLTGCGGQSGVRRITWRLEDLNGGGIIDRSHITLLLDENGRLSGSGGCNRYTGSYSLEGESLIIEPQIAATMMACSAESLMQQEARFFEVLPAMTTASLDETGSLVLSGPQDQRLLFRRDDDDTEQPVE